MLALLVQWTLFSNRYHKINCKSCLHLAWGFPPIKSDNCCYGSTVLLLTYFFLYSIGEENLMQMFNTTHSSMESITESLKWINFIFKLVHAEYITAWISNLLSHYLFMSRTQLLPTINAEADSPAAILTAVTTSLSCHVGVKSGSLCWHRAISLIVIRGFWCWQTV